MLFLKKIPFLTLWLQASLIRILFLFIHYFRQDPYGMPIVARIDRFLPFGIIVEIGAIALLILPFAILSQKLKGSFKTAKIISFCYLLLGLLDLETYRFLKQHITLSFIQNYVKLSSLNDSTLLLSLQSDPIGNIIFSISIIGILTLIFLSIKKTNLQFKSSHWGELLILLVLASSLGSSLYWYNPSHNRHNRLNPPLYIAGNEIQNLVISRYEKPTFEEQLTSIHQFVQRDTNRTHFIKEYPFINMPIEKYCYSKTSPECLIDFDNDGSPRNLDCDDFDARIFPNQKEIPSDGIDQDCSGTDHTPMNIILIVGESFNKTLFLKEFQDSSRLGQFKRMAHLGGKLFPNSFANGFPSVYGAASIYLGIWNHPHQSIFGEFTAKYFKGFPEYLPKEQYQKLMVSGADPYFDNQAVWLNSFYDTVAYDKNNGLGSYNADQVVFDKAISLLDGRIPNKSFLLTLNNHTTHTPFKYPKDFKPTWVPKDRMDKFAKALDYFDVQLGRLMDYLTQEKLLTNTVFLVIGDHGMAITPENFKLPEFYGFEKAQTISGVFSANPHFFKEDSGKSRFKIDSSIVAQIDIAPTVLGIAGIKQTTHYLGQDLINDSLDNRPALFFKNGAISLHSKNNTTYSHLKIDTHFYRPPLAQYSQDSSQVKKAKSLAHLTHFLIHENTVWNPRFE
jgi:hypothetical protein